MKDKLVIVLMAALALCLIGIGAMMYVMWGKISSMDSVESDENPEPSAIEQEIKIGPIYSLETFIVNLDDPKYKKYLRLSMDLELNDPKSSEKIAQRLPQIRDAVLKILPSKRYEEVINAEGKNALRDEIISALNPFFGQKLITNIYFTEFVIQ